MSPLVVKKTTMPNKSLKICPKGHQFYKSSDCLACPVCAQEDKPENGFLAKLSAPARRALAGKEIHSLTTLSSFTVDEILSLHGIGPSAIPILHQALLENKLNFKKN